MRVKGVRGQEDRYLCQERTDVACGTPESLIVRPQDLGVGRLFESVRDAVIVAEANTGRVVLWNPAATKIFGYSVSEALKLRVEALVPERLKDWHRTGIARYAETGHGPYIDSDELLDLPALRKTGEEIRIEMSLSPIEPVPASRAEGRFVLAIVRDVTGRKMAEEEAKRLNEDLEELVAERTGQLEAALAGLEERERGLRRSEERYRAVVEQAAEGILLVDVDTRRILEANAVYQNLLGYTPEEMLRLTLYDVVPYSRENMDCYVQRVLERRRYVSGERRHLRKDGSLVDVEVSANVLSYGGDREAICIVVRDITERRQTEEMRARLAAIVESSDEAIIGKTLDGTITSWNKGAQKMYGYSAEEVVGKPIDILVPPDRPGEIPKILERVRHGEAVDHYETVRMARDGRRLDISLTVSPIRDSSGDIAGASTIARNITERKRAEEALREVRQAERSRLARDLHDGALQDLTYALAEAQLVQRFSEDPELNARLEQVTGALKRAGQGLRGAVYDLRLTDERDRPFPESLESLVELSRRMNPGCNIRLDLEDGFPSAPFGRAGVELLRIIQEALNNARRHSGARNVRVALRLEGGEIRAEISDDGRGFEPQASKGGLGMGSMRQRAEALGGELGVKSEPGKGTRVRVCVPLAPRVQKE